MLAENQYLYLVLDKNYHEIQFLRFVSYLFVKKILLFVDTKNQYGHGIITLELMLLINCCRVNLSVFFIFVKVVN